MNPSTSHPTDLSEHTRFGVWGNLRLAYKLMLVFSVVFLFAVIIAGLMLWNLNQIQAKYEDALSQGVRLQDLSDAFQFQSLQARRYEKNFLLRWTSEGYDTAYANYVPLFQKDVSAMRDTLKELSPFGPEAATVSTGDMTQEKYEADLVLLGQYLDTYEQSFTALTEAMKQYGDSENMGLQAEMRNLAHELEGKISDKAGLENLEITLLQARRREKDYLARKDQIYVDDVHTYVTQFKNQVAMSEALQPAEKTQLTALAGQYQTAFDTLVAKDREIANLNDATVAAARAMEPISAGIESLGEQLKDDDLGAARRESQQIIIASMITIAIILALTISISVWLERQITRPITSLTNTAQQLAAGNFEAKAEVASGDEIGTLAQTFNIMTTRLGKAFDDVRRRALAVQTSAEVSRRLSAAVNPRQLAVDVVEQVQSAFHYYHAHIYFMDESTSDLIMAGGTGEAGATMLARGHRVPKGRGLVGRAAATKTPVLVPDVTKAEGWLPNPLLPDTKSEAAVPISSGDQVLGVLDVQQDVTNGLDKDDITLLLALASQVAISLQQARSYEQSRMQAETEALINTIGQKIQRATSMEDTLQIAIREVGMALGAMRVSASVDIAQKTGTDPHPELALAATKE